MSTFAIVVDPKARIYEPEQLKNKPIAVSPFNGSHFTTLKLLEGFLNRVVAAYGPRRFYVLNYGVSTLRALAPTELVVGALEAAGIDPGARAETLTPEDVVRLVAALDAGA